MSNASNSWFLTQLSKSELMNQFKGTCLTFANWLNSFVGAALNCIELMGLPLNHSVVCDF